MAQSALGGKEAEEAYNEFVTELSNSHKKDKEPDMLQQSLEKVKQIQAIRVTPIAQEPLRHVKKVTKQ